MEFELRFFCDPSNYLDVCRTAMVKIAAEESFGLIVTKLNRRYMPCQLWPVAGVPKIVALWTPQQGLLHTNQNGASIGLGDQTKIVYAYIQ